MLLYTTGKSWIWLAPNGSQVSVKADYFAQARRRYLRMIGKWESCRDVHTIWNGSWWSGHLGIFNSL